LADIQEAKDVVEQQAGHDVRLLEVQVMSARNAVDDALAILASGPLSDECAAKMRKILAPISSRPAQKNTGGGV